MKENYCVYKHTSPSGKVYIGITMQEVKKRWRNGLGYKKNKFFYRAIQKYGWENIKHEILFSGLSEKEAKQKEIELIALYKSNYSKHGYNQTLGGEGCKGYKFTEDQKRRLSEIQKQMVKDGKNRIIERNRSEKQIEYSRKNLQKMHDYIRNNPDFCKNRKSYVGKGNPNYGKHASEETKKIWHEQRAGRTLTFEWRKKISENSAAAKPVRCLETNTVFPSVRKCADWLGLKGCQMIRNSCNGNGKKVRGYSFIWEKDFNGKPEIDWIEWGVKERWKFLEVMLRQKIKNVLKSLVMVKNYLHWSKLKSLMNTPE